MSPILFLDFDGVVMTEGSYRSAPRSNPGASDYEERHAFDRMDPRLVENVELLCNRIGAAVVLSTAWRRTTVNPVKPLPDGNRPLVKALRARGLKAPVVGATPALSPQRERQLIARRDFGLRGYECIAWLNQYRSGWELGDVVALDDEDHLGPLRGRWVQSDFHGGFQTRHLIQALRLFARRQTARPEPGVALTADGWAPERPKEG